MEEGIDAEEDVWLHVFAFLLQKIAMEFSSNLRQALKSSFDETVNILLAFHRQVSDVPGLVFKKGAAFGKMIFFQ